MVDLILAHPRLTLAALAVLAAGWYLVVCAIWPFAACPMCEGGRKYQNAKRKAWRRCRWCKGTGQRRRVGRAVWAYYVGSRRRASR